MAVLLVSPTYFGVCSHIGDLTRVCHSEGIPLIVDEAHELQEIPDRTNTRNPTSVHAYGVFSSTEYQDITEE
jgi:arginine/lysine/ornithine decarboxylase